MGATPYNKVGHITLSSFACRSETRQMNDSTSTYSRITNPHVLRAAQALWVAVVGFNWIVFVGVLPHYWHNEVMMGAYMIAGKLPSLMTVRIFWAGQLVTGLFALAVGLFIFWQQRDNRAALILSAMLSILMINFFLPFLAIIHQVDAWWRIPGLIVFMTTMGSPMLVLLTMPTGRFDLTGARYLFFGFLTWEALRFVLITTSWIYMTPSLVVTFLFLTTGLLFMVHRYRTRLTQLERQQTKLIVLGAVYILFGFYLAMFTVPVLALWLAAKVGEMMTKSY